MGSTPYLLLTVKRCLFAYVMSAQFGIELDEVTTENQMVAKMAGEKDVDITEDDEVGNSSQGLVFYGGVW